MLKRLLLLVILSGAWVAALWFGVSPDFAQWSLPQTAAIHALPPLFSLAGWLGWRRWRVRRAEARALSAEIDAENERSADIDAARVQTTAEEQIRRFGCDCRAVAMAQVILGEDGAPLAETDGAVYFSDFDPSQAKVEDGTPLLAHLRSGIHEALEAIYRHSPNAAALPVYVVPPAQVREDQFIAAVRAVQHELVVQGGAPASVPEPGSVLQLADGRNPLDAVIELFERRPGSSIVLLGLDSPWWHARATIEEVDPDADLPGQGVFALLLTHPDLAAADSDVPVEARAALHSLPVLARLHRPAVEAATGRKRAAEMARAVGGSMAHARRNAGLSELAQAGNASDGGEGTAAHDRLECGWLVHNSGTPARCGARMAGVGVALTDHGIELDPFDEATNVSTAAGELGNARSVGMLALAVAKAAATQSAVPCVEFFRDESLSVFFARPPGSGERAGTLA